MGAVGSPPPDNDYSGAVEIRTRGGQRRVNPSNQPKLTNRPTKPKAALHVEVDFSMTESNDAPNSQPKPQDYAGLRAQLDGLARDFLPLMNDLWPRPEDHKYRWELHHFGLPDGYDKLVVSDIIALLIEALKGLGAAKSRLLHAHLKADSHNPNQPEAE